MLFNSDKAKKPTQIGFEVPVPEFVPYACHFNKHTILTKNGELLQILKIVGFTRETVAEIQSDLRQNVKDAIAQNVLSPNFALWFHTVRTKRNLDPGQNNEYQNNFARDTHSAWTLKNYWHDKFINELYITIIHQGQTIEINTPSKFLSSLSYRATRIKHEEALEKASNELDLVVSGMLESLSSFGVKRLSIYQDKTGVYSEPIQFFDKIIHMRERKMPVPVREIASYLASHKIAFGNNSFEVMDDSKKYFGAILSVKEYHEISTQYLDEVLQLPQEMVFTQSIEFSNSKEILEKFKHQDYVISLSNDHLLRTYSGLQEIFESNTGSATDYGYHQLTITVISEHLRALDEAVIRVSTALGKLGIITVREDLNLESCFWAQLPSNFSYINRRVPINTKAIGALASLHNFPAGKLNNIWGNAVALFRTALGTPYFFNFHYESKGHTCVIGPQYSGKITLVNFLLSESTKYQPFIFVIDQHYRSKLSIMALGGEYKLVSAVGALDESCIKFNPLALPDIPANREFLESWFAYLIFGLNQEESNEIKAFITELVKFIYQLPQEQRKLGKVIQLIPHDDNIPYLKHIFEKFAIWHGEGKYAGLFDNQEDQLDKINNKIMGFDVTTIQEDPDQLLLPILTYLQHKFLTMLDGSPAITAINEAWELLNNQAMITYLDKWLDNLSANNAVAIIDAYVTKNDKNNLLSKLLVNKMDTKIFLPDSEAENYKETFMLNDQEMELVKSMKSLNRNFLLKQGTEAIVAELNLAGLEHIISVLSGGEKNINLVNEIIERQGTLPENWLPKFYENCKNNR